MMAKDPAVKRFDTAQEQRECDPEQENRTEKRPKIQK
jgi:hypothetical protein